MAILPIPDTTKDAWTSMRDTLGFNQLEAMLDELKQQGGWEKHLLDLPKVATQGLVPTSPEHAFAGGVSGLTPGAFTKVDFLRRAERLLPTRLSNSLVAGPREKEAILNQLSQGLENLPPSWYAQLRGPIHSSNEGFYSRGFNQAPRIALPFTTFTTEHLAGLPKVGPFVTGHEIGHHVLEDLISPKSSSLGGSTFANLFTTEAIPELTSLSGRKALNRLLQRQSDYGIPHLTPPFSPRYKYWEQQPSEAGADIIGMKAAGFNVDHPFMDILMKFLKSKQFVE